MDVSIIVVSYNTRELLATCLRTLSAAIDGDPRYEVLVVDNASDDGSAAMVAREFPSARLIANTSNRGFAAANNQALAIASARYALLLNSDALLSAGSLQAMVRVMDGAPRVGVVGGRLLNADGSFQSSFFDFPTWKSELLLITGLARWIYGPSYPSHSPDESTSERRVDWVSGALFMVRRAAIKDVGPLDEAFFMYAEEMDWCYRMRQSGWEVAYTPAAEAVHINGASAHRQPERRRAQVYGSKCVFARKHWSKAQALAFVASVRFLSSAKLRVWWLRSRITRGQTQARAEDNGATYRFLLARIPGVF